MTTASVLSGERKWHVEQADCLDFLASLPADSVDLCFFSPPYEDRRTYGIGFKLDGQAWVDWVFKVFQACLRACKGLVACVCEGKTERYRWSAVPALLGADLHRAGVHLRKPPAYHRVGIPGSGGPDWLRNDYEFIVCATRGGKLPWSDNTAAGHPPKWGVGGAMSNRSVNGNRANETNTHREHYSLPAIANPGNVIECKVGGGLIGSALAHENEAPFPEELASFSIASPAAERPRRCPLSTAGGSLVATIGRARSSCPDDVLRL